MSSSNSKIKGAAVDEKTLALCHEVYSQFEKYLKTPQDKAMFRRKLKEYDEQIRAWAKEKTESAQEAAPVTKGDGE